MSNTVIFIGSIDRKEDQSYSGRLRLNAVLYVHLSSRVTVVELDMAIPCEARKTSGDRGMFLIQLLILFNVTRPQIP